MKKITLIFSAIFIALSSFSQDYENAVKINYNGLLMGPFFKKINLIYERGLADNFSVYADVGLFFPKNWTNLTSNEVFNTATGASNFDFNTISINPGCGVGAKEITMDNLNWSGWNFGIGARLYPQSEAIKRFYLGAKVNFMNTGLTKIAGTDQDTFTYDGKLAFNFINTSLEIGNQFIIADLVSLDWTILGLGFSNVTWNGEYTTTDPNRDYICDKAEIDDWFTNTFSLPVGTLDTAEAVTTTDNSLNVKIKHGLPIFRSSLTLGIVF